MKGLLAVPLRRAKSISATSWETVGGAERAGRVQRVRLQVPFLRRGRAQPPEKRANESPWRVRQPILREGRCRHQRDPAAQTEMPTRVDSAEVRVRHVFTMYPSCTISFHPYTLAQDTA